MQRYHIEELVGEGGMGRVYRGRQELLDRPIAVKCVHPHLLSSPDIVAQFMAEARLASRLAHPNIVRIYDFGRTPEHEGGDLFMVMELVEGKDFASVLAAAPIPIAWGIDVLRQTLAALAEAHALGITHYDIKPENILLVPKRAGVLAKVIDFGVARMNGAASTSNGLVGTPLYMSPERVRGEQADVSADLYAVGAILYQVLTGAVLFEADTATEVLHRQVASERPDPRTVAPHRRISEALSEVCRKAVALRREDRFKTADEFSLALRLALDTETPLREPLEAPEMNPSAPEPREGSDADTTRTTVQGRCVSRSVRYRFVCDRGDKSHLREVDPTNARRPSRPRADDRSRLP